MTTKRKYTRKKKSKVVAAPEVKLVKPPLFGLRVRKEVAGQLVEGVIVHYIKGWEQMTEEQVKTFAFLGPNDKNYKSIRGPAGLDRVVVAKENAEGLWILPLWRLV